MNYKLKIKNYDKMNEDFMSTEERLAHWRQQQEQKVMSIGKLYLISTIKLYLISIILNFLPIAVMYLILVMTIGAKNIRGEMTIGFYIYFPFFIASSIINLSFFLLNIKFVRNDETMNFLAYYASSLILLIVTVCLFFWWGVSGFGDFIFISIYFFINFILAFTAKRIHKNKHKSLKIK